MVKTVFENIGDSFQIFTKCISKYNVTKIETSGFKIIRHHINEKMTHLKDFRAIFYVIQTHFSTFLFCLDIAEYLIIYNVYI